MRYYDCVSMRDLTFVISRFRDLHITEGCSGGDKQRGSVSPDVGNRRPHCHVGYAAGFRYVYS